MGYLNLQKRVVEGTLRKQEYQLRQAQFELAQLKHARAEISAEELESAKRAYVDATSAFQTFWNKTPPID